MRASRFLLVGIWGLLGFTSSANAALLGVCTFPAGCGPDFAITGAAVNYSYNAGTDQGVLTYNSTVGNASFLDGQLDPSWAYGNTSLTVRQATSTGNDDFTFKLTVDGSGNLLLGSGNSDITMNGQVMAFDSGAGGIQIAPSFNGTPLDGTLITGGTIAQLGWNATGLDFTGSINSSSLLTSAGFGTGVSGILNLSNISTGNIVWNQNWGATGVMDVVVPLPAAFWLFLTGLTALFSVSRKARPKA